MKIVKAILLSFCNVVIFVYSDPTYDCRTKDVIQLKSKEIAFFKTPGFPKLWYQNVLAKCNITFNLLNNEKNHRLYVRITLLTQSSDEVFFSSFQEYMVLNKPVFTFFDLSKFFINLEVAAIQGFIIFDDERDICPMETSTNSSYALYDETQIITILSGYEKNYYRNSSCIWKFSAPLGYGFKIVIETFDSSSKFIIENTTQILVNERSVKTDFPFYNSDNFIQIYLSKTITTVNKEFQAYISVVKIQQTKQEVNCTICENDNVITWSYSNDLNGYHNNVYCYFELIIPSDTEIEVNINLNGLEKGIDYIQYFSEFNNPTKLNENTVFKIDAHYNSTERSMLWEFISDGSYQGAGFILTFEKTECKCADRLLKCDDTPHGIMGDLDDFYYCSNLYCIFEIEPCDTSSTLFQVYSYKDETFDVFTVISNNETVLNINQMNIKLEYTYTAYLDSSNVNFFIANTYPSPYAKALYYMITPASVPEDPIQIILTSDSPNSAIDTAFNSFIVIELSPELHHLNLSIFVYCLDENELEVYNNESLTKNLINENCFGKFNIHQCEIKSNKIALMVKDSGSARIIMTEIKNQSKGCVFAESSTVVIYSTKGVGALANNESHCDFTILLDDSKNFYISAIWTSATMTNAQIFAGTDYSSKLFLEITSASSKTWNTIILNSKVYKIRVPKGCAIFLMITQNTFDTISQYPFKALFSTPNYGLAELPDYPFYMDINVVSYATKVTAIDYEMDVSDVLYFQDVNTQQIYYINKIGDFILFKNQSLTLYYEQNANTNSKIGALFLIETFEQNPLIN